MKKKLIVCMAFASMVVLCTNPADDDHNSGPGSLSVTITASEGTPRVMVIGPDTTLQLASSLQVDSLTPGEYLVIAFRFDKPPAAEALTGRCFGDTLPLRKIAVKSGKTSSVSLRFDEQPASGKLWVANNLGGTVIGFRQEDLAVPGSPVPAATLSMIYGSPKGIAFDSLGFLWVASFSKNKIHAFRPAALDGTGNQNSAATAAIAAAAIKNPWGLAFDKSGSLWISNWTSNTIVAYRRSSLFTILAQGDTLAATAPDIVIASAEVKQPEYLAFDSNGNLWVTCDDPASGASRLFMFSASNLGISGTPSPTIQISAQGTDLIGASGLAFDKSGNLWGTQSAALFELPATALTVSGGAAPSYTTRMVQPGGMVFDATGKLWIAEDQSQIVRYVPGTSGSGTNFNSSASLDYPAGLALYPPPPGYPIP